MAKVMRWTGFSAFYSKHEAETGFFIQIFGEVSLRVERPRLFRICAIGTVPPTILQSRVARTITHEKVAVTAPCDRQPKRVKKYIVNH